MSTSVPAETSAPASPHAPRIWIDLVDPAEGETAEAEGVCGLRLPSRDDLSEVESSSRHYVESGAIYLSAPLVIGAETPEARLTPVGFILTASHLVTLRYEKLRAFDAVAQKFKAHPPTSALDAFVRVMEEVIDQKADDFELVGGELEALSLEVFHRVAPPKTSRRRNRAGDRLREVLGSVGRAGDRLSKMRGSLLTVGRITAYVAEMGKTGDIEGLQGANDYAARLAAAREDVASLALFQETLANKAQFLLDAVLGFISIDQNDVIKVLTVVSVVGVPPTLVASMYGMNFKIMPELNWQFGYPYALGLIVFSALAPLAWFRSRGWF